MRITSEDVKELQKRIDVTYEVAEKLLLKNGGDMERAIKAHKEHLDSPLNKFAEEAKRIFKELLTYNIKITRRKEILMNLPLIIIVGLFLILNVDMKIWFGVISIGLILISESTVSIYKKENKEKSMVIKKEEVESQEGEEKASETNSFVEKAEATSVEAQASITGNQEEKDDDDDDYYEITIDK